MLAFAAACLAVAIFSGMDAVMKAQSLAIGAFSAMLFRTIFGIAISGAVFAAWRGRWPRRAALILHGKRGVVAAVSVVLFFWGLTRVPLAQGVALSFISPLVGLFLARVLLGERVGPRAIIGSALAFGGILVVLAGQARAEMGPEAMRGAFAILAAALLYGYNMILLRQQAQAAGPIEIAFFTNLAAGGVFLAGAPFLAVLPEPWQWPWLVFSAGLAFVSILLFSWAYARAEASYLAPVEYTAFVWAALLGWLVFAESVAALTIAGAALIVTGCVIAARRQAVPVLGVEAAI